MLKALIDDLCDDYDLDTSRISSWIKNKKGLAHFIRYLEDQGYEVKEYSWPEEKDPLSWGLEFKDDNPLLVAAKLRYLGENT